MMILSSLSTASEPSSIKSFNLWGVPTAIPVLEDLRNAMESLSFICFANNFATFTSFVWNFRTALLCLSDRERAYTNKANLDNKTERA